MTDECVSVYITCGSQPEAEALARALVEEALAACVNIVPGVTSIYRWQGELCTDQECLLLAKTRKELFPALRTRVQELHAYDTPCIVALRWMDAAPDYRAWVVEQTEQGPSGP